MGIHAFFVIQSGASKIEPIMHYCLRSLVDLFNYSSCKFIRGISFPADSSAFIFCSWFTLPVHNVMCYTLPLKLKQCKSAELGVSTFFDIVILSKFWS